MKSNLSGRRFLTVTLLNSGITVFEFLGGLFAGSLSLLSDAIHNASDTLAIILSYVADRISQRPQNQQKTYGYKRAQILSAFINAALLLLVSIFLIYGAIKRFAHPVPIKSGPMFYIALFSTLANFGSALLLNAGAKHNLNMKATYLHLLSDTLSSVGVIVGALLIGWFHIYWVDPLISILVSLYIIKEAWEVLGTTIGILMEGSPKLDYDAIKRDIMALPNVHNVHHLHAWYIDENTVICEMHVNMSDMCISQAEMTYQQINKLLKEKYQIQHVTIQPEVEHGIDEPLFVSTKVERRRYDPHEDEGK
ncbi:czcD protein [Lactobacillus selangorensis]|uniref:CzcD protein n=1 Tax=Lactobacillus selangorensis TaxID=81857 RepID=A0A0R2FW87_9LACO|nr:cation diffusion facilitator family transporter [Lactobacillus selangorensis]KRN28997.1 czcD protein [Lactobacillus selangorensis]KRN32593.1 czcD protein [Lactobacillus selangorensis]